MADEPGNHFNLADYASIVGENDELVEALVKLARRLLVIRPGNDGSTSMHRASRA
jgi:hypothetical protein